MNKRVKVIYDENHLGESESVFEYQLEGFINREDIEVLEIKYSHAEITDDNKRYAATSFSAMIIYKKIGGKNN